MFSQAVSSSGEYISHGVYISPFLFNGGPVFFLIFNFPDLHVDQDPGGWVKR